MLVEFFNSDVYCWRIVPCTRNTTHNSIEILKNRLLPLAYSGLLGMVLGCSKFYEKRWRYLRLVKNKKLLKRRRHVNHTKRWGHVRHVKNWRQVKLVKSEGTSKKWRHKRHVKKWVHVSHVKMKSRKKMKARRDKGTNSGKAHRHVRDVGQDGTRGT